MELCNSKLQQCTIQQILDEEKSKHIGLAQQNACFSTSKLLKAGKKAPPKPKTCW
jgi:hypothetical protein